MAETVKNEVDINCMVDCVNNKHILISVGKKKFVRDGIHFIGVSRLDGTNIYVVDFSKFDKDTTLDKQIGKFEHNDHMDMHMTQDMQEIYEQKIKELFIYNIINY